MPKIICFDIDNTLIDANGCFPESAQLALRQASKAGHKLIICTGRNRPSIQKRILEFGFDGVISSAGASVTYHGKEIFQKQIDQEHLKFFHDYCVANHITFFVGGSEYNSANAASTEVLVEHYHKPEVYVSAGERYLEECRVFHTIDEVTDGEKLLYFFSPKSIEEIQKEIGDYYQILPFANKNVDLSCGEVLQNGITKAYGIQKMVDYLGAKKEDVVAFGDGPNDIEMLQYAQLGIAMGNGTECALLASDFITKPIGEDGIWDAMKHFKFI